MVPQAQVEDDFQPAYYAGHGPQSFWHRNPDCAALRHGRRRGGIPMRSRVGAMKASGRRACPDCSETPVPVQRAPLEWGTCRRLAPTIYAVTCRSCGIEAKGVFSNNAAARVQALAAMGWHGQGEASWRCPKHVVLEAAPNPSPRRRFSAS